jgi:hypothetical protein
VFAPLDEAMHVAGRGRIRADHHQSQAALSTLAPLGFEVLRVRKAAPPRPIVMTVNDSSASIRTAPSISTSMVTPNDEDPVEAAAFRRS